MARKAARRTRKNVSQDFLSTSGSSGRSAMSIQRKINRDYGILFDDYADLFQELWKKPATKYIVGGAAIALLIPAALRLLRRYPQINDFVKENMDAAEEKISEIKGRVQDQFDEMRDVQH